MADGCAPPGEHLDVLARDVRFALRTMRVRPAHTLTAVLTLAIGLGANVVMFAVVDAVLLAPLPYRDADALVSIQETSREGEPGNLGYLSFVDLKTHTRSLSHVAAATQSTATFPGDGQDAERVNAMRVSREYFDLVGVAPVLGRPFTEPEDRPGAARRVVILSDALWRRRFGADPGVIGRPVTIADTPHVIVGVMPRGFDDLVASRFYNDAGLWFPLGYESAASFACRTCRHLWVFGRLAPGVSVATAQHELTALFAQMERANASAYTFAGARVTSLRDVFLGPVRPALRLLWGGVVLLLLVDVRQRGERVAAAGERTRGRGGGARSARRDARTARAAAASHRVGAAVVPGSRRRPRAGVGHDPHDRCGRSLETSSPWPRLPSTDGPWRRRWRWPR